MPARVMVRVEAKLRQIPAAGDSAHDRIRQESRQVLRDAGLLQMTADLASDVILQCRVKAGFHAGLDSLPRGIARTVARLVMLVGVRRRTAVNRVSHRMVDAGNCYRYCVLHRMLQHRMSHPLEKAATVHLRLFAAASGCEAAALSVVRIVAKFHQYPASASTPSTGRIYSSDISISVAVSSPSSPEITSTVAIGSSKLAGSVIVVPGIEASPSVVTLTI